MAHVPALILASTSPRRIDLLAQAGLNPRIIEPSADETPEKGEKPRSLVRRLSLQKASSVTARALTLYDEAIIVAADTIVIAPSGKILGKPRDERDAQRMLSALSGKTHCVLTGYCLLRVTRAGARDSLCRVVSSKVKIRKMDRRTISRYVATGEPMDKAGSYAAQGKGMSLIERIQGSYANVVGLPISQVMLDLNGKFNVPLFGDLPTDA